MSEVAVDAAVSSAALVPVVSAGVSVAGAAATGASARVVAAISSVAGHLGFFSWTVVSATGVSAYWCCRWVVFCCFFSYRCFCRWFLFSNCRCLETSELGATSAGFQSLLQLELPQLVERSSLELFVHQLSVIRRQISCRSRHFFTSICLRSLVSTSVLLLPH